MAEKLDEKEIANFQELLMSQLIQLDAVTQLLIEKGIHHEIETGSEALHEKEGCLTESYPKIATCVNRIGMEG